MSSGEPPSYNDLELAKRLWKRQGELDKEFLEQRGDLHHILKYIKELDAYKAHRDARYAELRRELHNALARLDMLECATTYTENALRGTERRMREAEERLHHVAFAYALAIVILAGFVAYAINV